MCHRRRSSKLGPVLLGVLIALAACPSPRADRCNSDLDCPNLQRCELGVCAPVSEDGGAAEVDAGASDDDAGAPPEDAGGADAGAPPDDAGDEDAGPDDAGREDAGREDAGASGEDAGSVVTTDGGSSDADGGLLVDGGSPPPCNGDRPTLDPCAASQPGLVACWDFENGISSGGDMLTVADHIHGFNAQGTGSIAPSIHGDGYQPGVTGSLSLAAPAEIVAAGPMSVDVWVLARSLPPVGSSARQVVYDSNAQFGIMLHSTGLACAASKATDSAFRLFTDGFPVGVWTHVTCTLAPDGDGLIAYIDGVEVARAAHDGVLQGPTAPLFIGANSPTGDEQLDGVIDDLRVFRARRSADDACWAAQP